MANVYKGISYTYQTGGQNEIIYIAPIQTTSIIKSMQVYNSTAGALDAIVFINQNAGSDFTYAKPNIAATTGVPLITSGNVIVLEAGDSIKVQVSTSLSMDFNLSVLEMTR